MAYTTLINDIKAVIKNNGNQEITGQVLQTALVEMVNELGSGYTYKGVATLSTTPDVTTPNIFYLLAEVGTYTNIGGIQHSSGIGIAIWDGMNWNYQNVPSSAVVQTDATLIANSTNPVQGGVVYSTLYGGTQVIITRPELTWTNGYITNTGGLGSPSGQYKYSNVIELNAGQTAVAKAAGNGAAAIGVWNSATTNTTTFVSREWMLGVTTITEFTYTATEHCYIRFGHNFAIDGSDFYLQDTTSFTGIVDDIEANTEQINEISPLVKGKTETETITLTPSWIQGYLTSTGSIKNQSSGTYYYSEPISVQKGDVVKCHIGGQGIGVIARYTAAAATYASVAEVVPSVTGVNDYSLTCQDWGYIRFCHNQGAISDESFTIERTITTSPQASDVVHFTIAEWNFGLFNHGVTVDGKGGIPDADVDATLPSLKEQFVNIAADILYVTEYSQYVDRSYTIDTYTTLLKQFYPYYVVTGNFGSAIFSKFPFTASKFVSLDSRVYIDGVISYKGKDIHIFLMHPRSMGGQEGVDTRVADINQVITYLQDDPYVIIAGDMNTYEVVELDPFKNAGYLCGNCGYQGNMNTYPDTLRDWYIDNVIVKGFNIDKFEVIEETSVSDHYPVKAKITAYL